MTDYDFALDLMTPDPLTVKRNKKKINELLDKYGSLEAIRQNADLADSFDYDFIHGDELIDEVLRERAEAQNSPQLQNPLLQTNQAALAREARAVRKVYHHNEDNNNDDINSTQSTDNEYADTKSDATETADRNNLDYQLGTLSAKHESQQNPATIGKDNAGGYSYGSYQIATNTGTMESYIRYLKQNPQYHDYYITLINAGGSNAAKIKSKTFEHAWVTLSKNSDFNNSQHLFIIETHLNRLLDSIKEKELLNLENRHPVIKDVLYSMSVQHFKAPNIVNNALLALKQKYGKDARKITDKIIIEELYNQRAQYVSSLPESQHSGDGKITKSEKNSILKHRYPEELKDALSYLD